MRVILGLAVLVSFATVNAYQGRHVSVPSTLIISGDPWSVIQVAKIQDDSALNGYTFCKAHMIELLQSDTDYDKADTIIHEAMHAFVCDADGVPDNAKYDNDDDGHQGIYFAAGRLADFIADNPQAVEYIRWARTRK